MTATLERPIIPDPVVNPHLQSMFEILVQAMVVSDLADKKGVPADETVSNLITKISNGDIVVKAEERYEGKPQPALQNVKMEPRASEVESSKRLPENSRNTGDKGKPLPDNAIEAIIAGIFQDRKERAAKSEGPVDYAMAVVAKSNEDNLKGKELLEDSIKNAVDTLLSKSADKGGPKLHSEELSGIIMQEAQGGKRPEPAGPDVLEPAFRLIGTKLTDLKNEVCNNYPPNHEFKDKLKVAFKTAEEHYLAFREIEPAGQLAQLQL